MKKIKTFENFSSEIQSNSSLSDYEKQEIEMMVSDMGGPISVILHLLENVMDGEKEFVSQKIDYITQIRHVSPKTMVGNQSIGDYIRGFGIQTNL